MSPAFIKGAEEQFPEAHLTFDKFTFSKSSTRRWTKYGARSSRIARS